MGEILETIGLVHQVARLFSGLVLLEIKSNK
jgi:hypothetical protein